MHSVSQPTPTRQEIAADLRRLAPLVENGSLDVRDLRKRLRITLWLFDRSEAERVLAAMTRAFGLPKVSERHDAGFIDFVFGAITIGINESIATRTETVTSTRDERVIDESLLRLCEKHRVDDDHVMDVVTERVHHAIADDFDLGPDETDPAPEPALDYDGDGRRYRDGDHS